MENQNALKNFQNVNYHQSLSNLEEKDLKNFFESLLKLLEKIELYENFEDELHFLNKFFQKVKWIENFQVLSKEDLNIYYHNIVGQQIKENFDNKQQSKREMQLQNLQDQLKNKKIECDNLRDNLKIYVRKYQSSSSKLKMYVQVKKSEEQYMKALKSKCENQNLELKNLKKEIQLIKNQQKIADFQPQGKSFEFNENILKQKLDEYQFDEENDEKFFNQDTETSNMSILKQNFTLQEYEEILSFVKKFLEKQDVSLVKFSDFDKKILLKKFSENQKNMKGVLENVWSYFVEQIQFYEQKLQNLVFKQSELDLKYQNKKEEQKFLTNQLSVLGKYDSKLTQKINQSYKSLKRSHNIQSIKIKESLLQSKISCQYEKSQKGSFESKKIFPNQFIFLWQNFQA